jgi:hypothetical protein
MLHMWSEGIDGKISSRAFEQQMNYLMNNTWITRWIFNCVELWSFLVFLFDFCRHVHTNQFKSLGAQWFRRSPFEFIIEPKGPPKDWIWIQDNPKWFQRGPKETKTGWAHNWPKLGPPIWPQQGPKWTQKKYMWKPFCESLFLCEAPSQMCAKSL